MRELNAIYVLWLREVKRFWRSKSRMFAMLAMPMFFLIFLGFGFMRMDMPGIPEEINYLSYLVPGIIGMVILFGSTGGGLSVLWDREFGFLKEIMVAPVRRISIVIGRIIGSMTTVLIQASLLLLLSTLIGFSIPGVSGLLLALLFLALISSTFIGLGLLFATRMHDLEGFQVVMNFVIFPIFFLSGALYPIENLPGVIKYLAYINPLTYGIDGLRGSLLGFSSMTVTYDLTVCAIAAITMIYLGAYSFEKSDSV